MITSFRADRFAYRFEKVASLVASRHPGVLLARHVGPKNVCVKGYIAGKTSLNTVKVRTDQPTNSPVWYWPYISLRIGWENLIKDQSISPLVIIILILITLSLYDVVILLGENWCWSLLGPIACCQRFSKEIYFTGISRWEIIPPAMMWAKVISLSNEVMNNLKLQCIQSQ